jgi:hypothetical protein
MKTMEIPYGHRIKITKKLKEFKQHRNKANEGEVAVETLNSTFSEMGVGVGSDSIDDQNFCELHKKENLEFDEEEQQRLFIEAVEEFRKGKKPEINLNSKKITVIKEVDEEVNEVKIFFLFTEKLLIKNN